MKRKYIQQTTHNTCGPVALFNLGQWSNKRQNYRALVDQCKPDQVFGTYYKEFSSALEKVTRDIGLDVKFTHQPTITEIETHLKAGGCAILLFHWEDKEKFGEHYVFIDEFDKEKGFRCVNLQENGELMLHIKRRKFHNMLNQYSYPVEIKHKYDSNYPSVWLFQNK
jgi:hypothetical protein